MTHRSGRVYSNTVGACVSWLLFLQHDNWTTYAHTYRLLIQIFAHEGFVKAWAKIWIKGFYRSRTCLDRCSFSTSSFFVTPYSVLPARCGAQEPQRALFCCLHTHNYTNTFMQQESFTKTLNQSASTTQTTSSNTAVATAHRRRRNGTRSTGRQCHSVRP